MERIREHTDLKGKRVLVRASVNVPIENGTVKNDFRLQKMLPIINFLREAGARTILVGHLSGDPATHTLRPVADYLGKHFPITFIADVLGEDGQHTVSSIEDGAVVLVENLRRHPGETANDEGFARALAGLADIYVNEDFPTAHRLHASVVGVPRFLPSYTGLRFEKEYTRLSEALNPPTPSLVVIAGAKPETKVPLALQFLEVADTVFVGGLSGNEFFAAKGYVLASKLPPDIRERLVERAGHTRLVLPEDVRVVSGGGETVVKPPIHVAAGEQVVDVGPRTLAVLDELVRESAFLVWNGPLGDTDNGFTDGTERFARIINQHEIRAVVGGGDTITALDSLDFNEENIFLSTAGAAMIDFLADGTLVGIEALEKGQK